MSAFASTVDRYDDLQGHPANWATGAFGDSSKRIANDGGDHGAHSFNNFTTKGGYGSYGSISHKDNEATDGNEENILLRNIRNDIFGSNSPWGKQKESVLRQILNTTLDALGLSTGQKAETMSMLTDMVKEDTFVAPTISNTDSQETIARKIIAANPTFFAQAPTGEAVELSDFNKEFGNSCQIPQGIEDMCSGNGLPQELAIPLFVANMELTAATTPTLVTQRTSTGPSLMLQ